MRLPSLLADARPSRESRRGPRWLGWAATLALLSAAAPQASPTSDPALRLLSELRSSAGLQPTQRTAIYERLVAQFGRRADLWTAELVVELRDDARASLGVAWGVGLLERLALQGRPETGTRARLAAAELLVGDGREPGEARGDALAHLGQVLDPERPGHAALSADELQRAEALRWRLLHLSVGVRVPAFRTADRLGNEIVLGRLLGQVVLVRFWAPDELKQPRMLRHERELHDRLWDERFALIGLSTASPDAALVRRLDALDVRWEVGHEPDARGARRAWLVERPGSYLLDHLGVLRAVDLEYDALEARIGELLAERDAWERAREAELRPQVERDR